MMRRAAMPRGARHHEIKFVVDRERQQAGGGGFDQALVRAQIGFLAEPAGGDQNAVGADTDRRRALLGSRQFIGGEQRTDAVDFRKAAGLAMAAVGEFHRPVGKRGAVGGAANKVP